MTRNTVVQSNASFMKRIRILVYDTYSNCFAFVAVFSSKLLLTVGSTLAPLLNSIAYNNRLIMDKGNKTNCCNKR